MEKKIKYKGLWFFGLSGTGNTYISKKISKKMKNSFIIDGDVVRSLVSFDLGYSLKDRVEQNKRVLGLAKIVILNNQFPIISSVYLDPKISKDIKKNKINIINLIGKKNTNINKKLSNKKNVVGRDINQPKINCEVLENNFKSNIIIKKYAQKSFTG
jgi:ATP-dependent 26S proteasome regulatory subunit